MDYLKSLIEEYLDEMDKFIAYQEWLVTYKDWAYKFRKEVKDTQ